MKKGAWSKKLFVLLLFVLLVVGNTVQAAETGALAAEKTSSSSTGEALSKMGISTVTVAAVAVKSVKMNKASVTLLKGKAITLSAKVIPANAANKSLKWKSSNLKVAKVDGKGKVTAVGPGSAKITASSSNGKTATAVITVPYSKSLSAGTWKAGTHLPAGRYKITTNSYAGNLFIAMGSTDRFVNEILAKSSKNGVTAVTTDIKKGDKIEIMGLEKVQFTQIVSRVKSNTLHAGHWIVGKDINAGRYKITTTDYMGNLFVKRGQSWIVNEILSAKKSDYSVTSVTTTLKNGDKIQISGMNKVLFKK